MRRSARGHRSPSARARSAVCQPPARCRPAGASQPLAQPRGEAPQPVPDAWGARGDPWSPAFRGGIRSPPGSLPPLPVRSRPLPAAPPASVLLAAGKFQSFRRAFATGLLIHLRHRPPLPALSYPGETLSVSRFRTNVEGAGNTEV